jgi:hypothetical protein
MPKSASLQPNWDTSSYGEPAENSALNRSALSEHLSLCGALRSPVQAVLGEVSWLLGWMSDRTITAALLIGALVGAAWLAI